ncbi:MAG: hypothetical protein AAGK37_19185 [Pseudomonadota bacterium]
MQTVNTNAIANGFQSLAQALVPNTNAMIQADLALGRRSLMEAQGEAARAQALLSQARAETEPARREALLAQAAQANANAELLGAQTEGVNLDNLDTTRRQAAEDQLADLMAGGDFSQQSTRGAAAGQGVYLEGGLPANIGPIAGASAYVQPGMLPPGALADAFVGTGAVENYGQTGAGVAANDDQRLAEIITQADQAIRMHELGVGSGSGRAPQGSVPRMTSGDLERLDEIVVQRLSGPHGAFPGVELAPGIVGAVSERAAQIYMAQSRPDMASAVAQAIREQNLTQQGGGWFSDPTVQSGAPAQPAPQAQPTQPTQPAQPASPGAPTSADAMLPGLQPGQTVQLNDGSVFGRDGQGYPIMLVDGRWVPVSGPMLRLFE